MPWLKWLPWRFLIRRAARAHGFLDPVALLGHLHRFSQPSEVGVPLELLRAGVVFHARGLINSRVIQHNLDWVWPYWIERQFDPHDVSFVPRAFTITHVNLTHRNWTALGVPDLFPLAIVDPRGLLTPMADGWSLDCWVVGEDGRCLLPSRARQTEQRFDTSNCTVVTESRSPGMHLCVTAGMGADAAGERTVCSLSLRAQAEAPAWMVLALRPYNAEGVSFVHRVELADDRGGWIIDERYRVDFSVAAERHRVSVYREGDVYIHLQGRADERAAECDVGMATAAAMFRLEPGRSRDLTVCIPVDEQPPQEARQAAVSWSDSLHGCCRLCLPEARYVALYETALRTLVIHSPLDVYPGPYTYKRFWFRDAAFIIHALLCAGLTARAERALDRFPLRQDQTGYFHSQEGEWDANGEALWIMRRFCTLTGRAPKPQWHRAIRRGAQWIARKRLSTLTGVPHAGLLPAGFSAEHLGPNDYYYWDDFWGVGGLHAAESLLRGFDPAAADGARAEAEAFAADIERSLEGAAQRLGRPAIPASPYRRLDAGAIGSLACGYPLQWYAPDDPRLLDTADFLYDNCFCHGGFFQDMIHSGINPYLTLHIAQVFLRAGDVRHLALTACVAALASPTGQWPEAIHPHTLGGCMGDGQHVWAAAEWVLMMRNGFVREEGDRLVLCSGIAPHWLVAGATLSLGPAPTDFGAVTVTIEMLARDRARVSWRGDWHGAAPAVEVRLPTAAVRHCAGDRQSVVVELENAS